MYSIHDGNRYTYQNNLGGLCFKCNECDYEVFGSNIKNEIIQVNYFYFAKY